MRSVGLCIIAVVVVACSCGGSGGGARPAELSSHWTAPSILSHVPQSSPYLVALLEPVNESLRRRMMQGVDERITEALRTLEKLGGEAARRERWVRAAIAILNELRGKDVATWEKELGLDPRGRFVLYGLSVWPVMRFEISDPTRLRAVITRVLAAADVQPQQRTLDGHAYWLASSKEVSFVASVLDREVVAALVPTASLDTALPLVLGTRMPERNLAQAPTVPELFGRHRFLGTLLAYVDAHRLVDIVAGDRPEPFDAPLRTMVGAVPPACRSDLDRLAAIAPRFVMGYHRLDDAGFEASAVLETAPAVVSGLRKLHTTVPEVTAPMAGHPLFAFGAAIEPRELVAWLQSVTGQLHAHPFACPWFAGINEAGGQLADKLATPLPPTWLGVRGFSMVLDDMTVSPLDFTGHVLVAGERVADLVSSLAGTIPAIAGIPLARDGRPIAVPAQLLHLPVRSAHLALTTDRLVIAAGNDSERRATEHLASRPPRTSPLLLMAFDMPRMQELLAAFNEAQGQGMSYIRDAGMSVDLVDSGITLDIWGTWQASAPPATGAGH